MRRRSAKPRVIKRAVGAPLRSSSALVPRVVASRMAISGSSAESGVRVTSRAARTGASSGERSSKATPARSPAIGSSRRRMVESESSTVLGSLSLPSNRKVKPRKNPCGRSQAVARWTTSRSTPAIRPRTALVKSASAEWRSPPGCSAGQSVKVPPVSIQICQDVLFTDERDHLPLGAPAVEFAVEDLFPGSEVEAAVGDRHHPLAAHDLPLVVGVRVVLAGAVVLIALRAGIEGGQLLQPALVVLMQARLVVIDEDARRDVHGVDQAEPFADAALGHRPLHLRRDVDEVHPRRDVHRQMTRERSHAPPWDCRGTAFWASPDSSRRTRSFPLSLGEALRKHFSASRRSPPARG